MKQLIEDLKWMDSHLSESLKPENFYRSTIRKAIEELSKRTYSEDEVIEAINTGRVFDMPPNEILATLNAEQDASLTTPDGDK